MEKRFEKISSSLNNIFEIKLSKSCHSFSQKSIVIKKKKKAGDSYKTYTKNIVIKNSGEGILDGLLSSNSSFQLCLHGEITEGMNHKHIIQRCCGISVNSLCPNYTAVSTINQPLWESTCTNHYKRYNEVVRRMPPWTTILH